MIVAALGLPMPKFIIVIPRAEAEGIFAEGLAISAPVMVQKSSKYDWKFVRRIKG